MYHASAVTYLFIVQKKKKKKKKNQIKKNR